MLAIAHQNSDQVYDPRSQSFAEVCMRSLAVTIALIATVLASPSLSAQNRGCEETRNPKNLPSASDVIDSASAIAELKQSNLLAGDMRFTLLFDETDSFPRVRPLQTADPGAAMVLMRSIWPQKPSDPWAVRVHVVGGTTPSLTLERSIYCPPTPESGSPFPTRIAVQMQAGDRRPPPGTRYVRLSIEALIDEAGVPSNVRITQSSGMGDLDDAVLKQWEARRFHPALIDGEPIRALFRTGGQSPRM
jgi:TonB-like protein